MTLLGSQDTGLGSVDTASGGAGDGSGGGDIEEITSTDGSVTITGPTGPITDLSVPAAQPPASAVTGLSFPIVAGTPTLSAVDPVVLPGLVATGGGVEVATGNFVVDVGVPATIHGTLEVDGATTLNGALNANNGVAVQNGETVQGGLEVVTGTFVADAGVPATIHDTLEVDGATTMNGALAANNGAAISGVGTINGQPIAAEIVATTVNSGGTPLSGIAAASLTAGSTLAWVKSVGAFFLLQISALAVDHITVETASGLAGAQWVRLAIPNRAFWTASVWHIDPINGSDESIGTGTGANALKTCAEWTRRMLGSIVAFIEIIFDNDIPDADSLVIPCTAVNGQAFIEIAGSQTVVSTQTVASAQARASATNAANQITVTGFDFSAFLNTFVRVQGTQNYAAITKVLTTVTANDTARLSELWNTSSNTQASTTGIAALAIIEIVSTRKGPLSIVNAGNCTLAILDVRQDGTGNAFLQNVTTQPGNTIVERFIFGGTSTGLMIGSFIWTGGLIKCPSANVQGMQLEGTAITCPLLSFQGQGQNPIYVKARSTVWQGAPIVLAGVILHVDQDLGQFDLPAAAIGISVNGTSVGEGSLVNFNTGRHYGSGNNATANVWTIGFGSFVKYVNGTPPTMDAGNGVNINGGNVALGSLPVNLSLTNGSAVYAL